MSVRAEFDESTIVDRTQADPAGAIRTADAVLADRGATERDRAVALWARGLARRELDQLADADRDLEQGWLTARAVAPALAARIAVTWALVVMYRGDASRALRLLDEAEPDLPDDELGSLHVQRGIVRHRQGDLRSAEADYRAAVARIGDGDPVLLARALINLSTLDVQRGRPSGAVRSLERARTAIEEREQPLLRAFVEHNLGVALSVRGDVVDALAAFDRADRSYRSVGDSRTRLAVVSTDRAATMLSAGLLDEADRESSAALETLDAGELGADRAEAALLAARVRLALADTARATVALDVAAESFEHAGRTSWLPIVDLLRVEVDALDGPTPALARRARRVAHALEAAKWDRPARDALLLCGRLALQAGSVGAARQAFDGIVRSGVERSPFDQSAYWLARASLAEAEGDVRAARRAVTRGLRALWDSRLARSHFELRAHASRHALAFADLGYRLSVDGGRAREFIERVDIVNRLASLPTSTRSPADPHVRALLEELHGVRLRSAGSDPGSSDAVALERRRRELERSIANAARLGLASSAAGAVSTGALIDALGETSLFVAAILDNTIHRAVLRRGRARFEEGIDAESIGAAIDSQLLAVARQQRPARSKESAEASVVLLEAASEELDRLVPDSIRRAGGPVVVVVPGRLTSVCWGTLPSLRHRPVVVSPSWTAWHFAHRRREIATTSRVLLVAGPDLEFAHAECSTAAARYPDRMVDVVSDVATTREKLAVADIAHFACHGTFRRDNPLFSSLLLEDGSLTFYDLEQSARVPHTVVLSACDVGRTRSLHGAAVLGLATSLLHLGVASVIAPLTRVNDARSLDLMARLHERLAAGDDPATALANAALLPDGTLDPAASPFVCFGS